MIELPELSILLILDHLSYEDLQSLRVTCKKLKAIVDKKTPKSLHLFVNCYWKERELLHTGELVCHANTFQAPELTILRSTKFKNQFIGLLKLTIYTDRNGSDKTVNLDDLNCFQGLVHLQLENVTFESGRLSLRNLKIALFKKYNYKTTDFDVDCPHLQVLDLGYQTRPRLTQETASSVRYLYLRDGADDETSLFLLYGKLNNLSTISFGGHYGSEGLNSFVVALMERRMCLPSLKRIRLKEQHYFPERGVVLKNLAELKSRQETKHLEVLINRKVMESDELTELLDLLHKIFSDNPDEHDDQENTIREIREYTIQNLGFGHLEGDLLHHFGENPILHCLLPSVYGLTLRSDEDVKISKQLIGGLGNLERLAFGIELDENFFDYILKTCRRIWDLQIFGSANLRQWQLDQLPDYLQNLTFLALGYELEQRNLNFVTKFKHLSDVLLYFDIPKETMSFLFKNNHRARFEIEFYGIQKVSIDGWRNGQFRIICDPYGRDPPKTTEFDCLEEAIDHYYRNDLFYTPWVEGTEIDHFDLDLRFPIELERIFIKIICNY